MKKGFSELRSFIRDQSGAVGFDLRCLVDTSILFAESYTLDPFNEEVEMVFDLLAEFEVPVYSNFNVRTEFLELHRRIVIAECLIDFLKDYENTLDVAVEFKLKSLRTRYRNAQAKESQFRLSEKEIKDYRFLLAGYKKVAPPTQDGWEVFCATYLRGKIGRIWTEVVDQLGLNFFDLRSKTDLETLSLVPSFSWEGVTDLIERFGLGSVDAMILDLFKSSDCKILLTTDRDLGYCVDRLLLPNRIVFMPDRLL